MNMTFKQFLENIEHEREGELKQWLVAIGNNYYNGKYADYGYRYFPVLARTADEARQVAIDNGDFILQRLLAKKLPSGRRVLPPNSARPITAKSIGRIKPGTVMSDEFRPYASPHGIVNAIVQGDVVEIKDNQTDL